MALRRGQRRTYRVSRVRAVHPLDQTARRPAGFDLAGDLALDPPRARGRAQRGRRDGAGAGPVAARAATRAARQRPGDDAEPHPSGRRRAHGPVREQGLGRLRPARPRRWCRGGRPGVDPAARRRAVTRGRGALRSGPDAAGRDPVPATGSLLRCRREGRRLRPLRVARRAARGGRAGAVARRGTGARQGRRHVGQPQRLGEPARIAGVRTHGRPAHPGPPDARLRHRRGGRRGRRRSGRARRPATRCTATTWP